MHVVRASQVRAEMRTQAELDGILRIIAKQYVPVFRSGAVAMLDLLGRSTSITAPECTNVISKLFTNDSGRAIKIYQSIVGDLFFHENRVFALQPNRYMLTAWEISQHSATPLLPDFCEAVSKAAKLSIDGRRLRGMNFDWTELDPPQIRSSSSPRRSKGLTRPLSELVTKAAVLSEDTVSDANLLVDRGRRDFLVRLAQLGKARSADAKIDVEIDNITILIDRGLVRKEFLVLCKKDSHTLCSVDDKTQLAAEVRCAVCGRPFSDEIIQEIYALTDRGRAMLEGSHWMTVWVTSILVDSGIPLEQILWGATSGEDEIDIIAYMGDQSIFFELKDRMFGLGDAYPFTARVQRYGAAAGVIISMDGIAKEVQKFLTEQAGGQTIYTLSGDREIKLKVPAMLNERAKASAIDTIKEVFMPVGIDPTSILAAWPRRRTTMVRRRTGLTSPRLSAPAGSAPALPSSS